MFRKIRKQKITWGYFTNKPVLLVVVDREYVGVPVQGVNLLGLGGYLALWTCYWSFPTFMFFNSILSQKVCRLALLLPTYISIAEWALNWFLPGFVGEATGIIWTGF